MNNPNSDRGLHEPVIPVGDEEAEAARAKHEAYADTHPGSSASADLALEDELTRDRMRLQSERAEQKSEEEAEEGIDG